MKDLTIDQFVWQCDHRFGEEEATLCKGVIVADESKEETHFRVQPLGYFCEKVWRPLNSTSKNPRVWFPTKIAAIAHARKKHYEKLAVSNTALNNLLGELTQATQP
jgi:hypothetical protein